MKTALTLLFLALWASLFGQVTADAGPDRKMCVNDTLAVKGKGLNPGDTGSYTWRNLGSGVLLSNTDSFSLMGLGGGIHLIELTVTKTSVNKTFSDADSFMLSVYGLPLVDVDVPDLVCSSNPPFPLNNTLPAGNVGTWSGVGVSGRSFDPSVSPRQTKYGPVITVKFEYTHPLTGCKNSDTARIIIQSAPAISILNTKPYHQCEGSPFDQLSAVSSWANQVMWTSNGDGTFNDPTKLKVSYTSGNMDTSTSGLNRHLKLYVMTIKEGVCPSAKDSIEGIIEQYPKFDFIANDSIQCEPAIVQFQCRLRKPADTSNILYSWWFGNGDVLSKQHTYNPGNIRYDTAKRSGYDIRVAVHNQWGQTDQESCSDTVERKSFIKVIPVPHAHFVSTPAYYTYANAPVFHFYNRTSIRWGADNLYFIWNFDVNGTGDTSTQKDPVHRYSPDSGTYWVNMFAAFRFTDAPSMQTYICWDSVGQPRKIGPKINDLLINIIVQNESIMVSVPFDGELKVIDFLGRMVETRRVRSGDYVPYDISNWVPGIYYFELLYSGRKSVKALVKY